MRRIGIGELVMLWALWAYAFVQTVSLGLHFEHHFLRALLPDPPSFEMTSYERWEYAQAVALIWGTPVVLAILSWRMVIWCRRQ